MWASISNIHYQKWFTIVRSTLIIETQCWAFWSCLWSVAANRNKNLNNFDYCPRHFSSLHFSRLCQCSLFLISISNIWNWLSKFWLREYFIVSASIWMDNSRFVQEKIYFFNFAWVILHYEMIYCDFIDDLKLDHHHSHRSSWLTVNVIFFCHNN